MLAFGRVSLRLASQHGLLVSRPVLSLRGFAGRGRDFRRRNDNGGDFSKRNKKKDDEFSHNPRHYRKLGKQNEYEYSGEDAPDVHLDIARIEALINDRARARGGGNFDKADNIRDILLDEFGVVVDDREKEWSTTSKTGRKDQEHQIHHDYRLADDAGPIQSPLRQAEIENLILKRLKCKLNRNFGDADVLLQKLRDANVSVHDKRREWRADGVYFDFVQNVYAESTFSQETTPENKALIKDLVLKRYDCRTQQHFKKADQLLKELRNRFNVEVNDRLFTWSVGGDFGILRGAGDRYRQSQASKRTEYGADIQKLVDQRNRYRNERNFKVADGLRKRLYDDFGVTIDDDASEWSVRKRERKTARVAKLNRRGEGALSPEDEASVLRLVKERSLAKYEKNFPKADQIRERLVKEFRVRVDDKKMEWMLISDQYVFKQRKSAHIDEDTLKHITQKISERATAKMNADFALADSIMDKLSSEYNVYSDDRTREWWVKESDAESDADLGYTKW